MKKLLLTMNEVLELGPALEFAGQAARRRAKGLEETAELCAQENAVEAAARAAASCRAKAETLEGILRKVNAALIAPDEEEDA